MTSTSALKWTVLNNVSESTGDIFIFTWRQQSLAWLKYYFCEEIKKTLRLHVVNFWPGAVSLKCLSIFLTNPAYI